MWYGELFIDTWYCHYCGYISNTYIRGEWELEDWFFIAITEMVDSLLSDTPIGELYNEP